MSAFEHHSVLLAGVSDFGDPVVARHTDGPIYRRILPSDTAQGYAYDCFEGMHEHGGTY